LLVAATTGVVAVASVTAIRAAVTTVPIAVAATIAATVATITAAVARPGCGASGRTRRRATIVMAVVPRTPGSRTTGGAASPGPSIAAAAAGTTTVRAVAWAAAVRSRAGFDARRSGARAAKLLHELL
jgi:hypothetical protein